MTVSDWLAVPPADPELLDQALAGIHQIAVEAGVLEQTWRAANMGEVCKIIADRVSYQREHIAELLAEVARLKAELDQVQQVKTIHTTTANSGVAIRDNTGEDPGTVLRETDGLRREWVLGEDHIWRTR